MLIFNLNTHLNNQTGNLSKVIKLYSFRRCKCGSKTTKSGFWPPPPVSDLEEKVAETQRIGNETQRMLKIGKKWLKNLYNAHLEENHDFKEKDAEEKDGDWNNWGED